MTEANEIKTAEINTSPASGGSAWGTFLRRGFSTIVLLTILLGVYFSRNSFVYLGLIMAFCLVASLEWCSMLKASGIKICRWLVLLAGVFYPFAAGIVCIGSKGSYVSWAYMALAPALVAIFAFLYELRRPVDGRNTLLSLFGTIASFVYPVWMFCFTLPLLFVPPLSDPGAPPSARIGGVFVVLWVILVTKIMDMGAYLSGSLFGRHKMIPHISPKKTWEGFFGACVITVLAGVGLNTLFGGLPVFVGWSVWEIALLSLFLGLVSVVGDLAGSIIKRGLGVKDSGNLLPGIGGVYDLIDSPAFTLPIACLLFCL